MSRFVAFSGTSRTLTEEKEIVEIGSNNLISNILNISNVNKEEILNLEEIIDLDKELENYRKNKATILNPRKLYEVRILKFNPTELIKTNREVELLVTTEPKNEKLIKNDTVKNIAKNSRLTHLGLIIIGIKELTRNEIGAKVLIMLIDKRWNRNASKAIIASMEVDMSRNIGLFYCSPDMLIGTRDLEHIEIGIQTRGYEEFTGESNILVNIGFIGRGTTTSTVRYKLNIEDIINSMASKGIKMIKPMIIDSDIYEGLEWVVSKNLKEEIVSSLPEDSIMYRDRKGQYSLKFGNYKQKQLVEEEDSK